MIIKRLSKEIAKRILVEGTDRGFSIIKLKDTTYNVYHREYKDKLYDILEIEVEDVSVYELLDHEEAIQLCKLYTM